MKWTIQDIAGEKTPLFIGGNPQWPGSKSYLDSFNPSTGKVWYQAADAGPEDVDLAVNAAKRALANPAWCDLTQSNRGALLFRLAELISQNIERLAQIETEDNGKLIREMRAQLTYLPQYYRYFAGMADKVQGEVIPINKPQTLNFTLREPIGVVGIIVPWNSPLYMMSCTVAPCLAIGNAVVIKPSEHTSASALAFAELVKEAGFPDGVFNVVTGYGHTTGYALTRHPGIAKIAFTGGTATGRKVAVNAGERLIPCNLELGGKSPHVVFADADLDRAVNGVIAGIFAAAGQTCIAGSRCFIQAEIYDEVIDRLKARTEAIKIGPPRDQATQLGPLALKAQLEKVSHYVACGMEEGAKLVTGGKPPVQRGLGDGWYFEPTIFANVNNDMKIAREEIFGPVAGVLRFSDEDELIRLANDTPYGLASGIWTKDIDRALRFAHRIEAGTVWINTYRSPSMMSPAGGFKESGYGKHNGFEAIREYSRVKSVIIDHSGTSQDPFVMRFGDSKDETSK
ncbi:MAG: aldehyde dehydrogenase [Pseudomonadota bacterium]